MFSKRKLSLFSASFFILLTSRVMGFDVSTHEAITDDSLNSNTGLTAEIYGLQTHFSDLALFEIKKANIVTDYITPAWTSSKRHFTDQNFDGATQYILDARKKVVASLAQETPNGFDARYYLGQALHTIQDRYAHSNWEELFGAGVIDGALGNSVEPNPDPSDSQSECPANHNTLAVGGGSGQTSGYFTFFPPGCGFIPAGKCYHGNYADYCVGINKDRPTTALYSDARAAAKKSTDAFVQSIIDQFAGNDIALSALLDARGDIGFIVDTTGSMGDEIGLVKTAISYIASAINAVPFLRPDNWNLTTFNDPDYGPSLEFKDVNQFLSAVSVLTASGGGDCPELQWDGILLAVQTVAPNSRLFVFTDATSKDGDLAAQAIQIAQQKNIQITYLNSGTCSPIDPTYMRGASETGGQFYFLQRSEMGVVAQLINPFLKGAVTRVLSRQLALPATGSITIPIPVDTTVSQLIMSVATDVANQSITLLRPSGVAVSPADTDVQFTTLSVGTLIAVTSPSAGIWTMTAAGSGNVSIDVDVNSPLQLLDFSFVQANNDIHGGYFPITGQPQMDLPNIGQAILSGPYSSETFSLVGDDGTKLSDVTLSQNYPNGVQSNFIGSLSLPATPFRFSVTGQDANGATYQRLFPTLFSVQPVGVSIKGDPRISGPIGGTTSLAFVITNSGPGDTFNLKVTDTAGFGLTSSSTTITIAQGESQSLSISLTIPSNVPEDFLDTVTLTASSTTNISVANSGNVIVATTASPNPVANAGENETVQCAGSRGTSVTLDGTGSFSPTGSPLTFTWSGIFGTTTGPTPTVVLPVGSDPVFLTVNDSSGRSSQAINYIKVVDTSVPRLHAALVPLTHDADDREETFLVRFGCFDKCEKHPNVSANINNTPVRNDQLVRLKIDRRSSVEREGPILELSGRSFQLSATCTGSSGQTSTATVTPVFRQEKDEPRKSRENHR